MMNQARERLAAGLPEQEIPAFQEWVRRNIATIETACQQAGIDPSRLAAPTYRAYRYLKELDLNNLPIRQGEAPPAGRKVRITNLVTAETTTQNSLWDIIKEGEAGLDLTRPASSAARLLAKIQTRCAELDRILQESQASASGLPVQSRRAYQWLKFLSDGENFSAHLAALKIARRAGQQAPCKKRLPAAVRQIPVQVEFAHQAVLYRTRTGPQLIEISAHQGFIAAPPEMIEALVCAALQGKESPHLERVRLFAASEEFAEILAALELAGESGEPNARGQHYDLGQVFERVNAAYFGGRLERPRLTWNRVLTHSKLGHYQPATDTVMISITLDQAYVPPALIDFVMYHELLHKDLGIAVVNGRRYAHTPAFRERERQFRGYATVQEQLHEIARRVGAPQLHM